MTGIRTETQQKKEAPSVLFLCPFFHPPSTSQRLTILSSSSLSVSYSSSLSLPSSSFPPLPHVLGLALSLLKPTVM